MDIKTITVRDKGNSCNSSRHKQRGRSAPSKGRTMTNPIYTYGDHVYFNFELQNGKILTLIGEIQIVDKHGTFEQNEEPSYDIMVEDWMNSGKQMFIKHIRESEIKGKEENA